MNHRKKNIMSHLAFRLWKAVSPSLSERFQYFDTRMFLKNEMDPNFPWRKYVGKVNPYFKKWGFKVSQLDAEYYSRVSGVKADHYVTRSMAVHYIYPYLDRYDFVPAYMDKNIQNRLLSLPDTRLGVMAAEAVVYNSNGVFFNSKDEECDINEALEICKDYGEDLILKPSVETYGGRGVMKMEAHTTREQYLSLFKQYNRNFTLQKIVRQHPVMEEYNPSSVNTVRIVTYRDFQRKGKVLYSCLRFGGKGSVMDNVCSGGGYTGIDITTGRLLDRKRYTYYMMDVPYMPDTMPDEIPYWNEVKSAALALHRRLPQLDIVGWDFAISPKGKPVLIEFNPRPGVGLQQAVGPMFSREDLDEIMSHVSKVEANYSSVGVIKYKDYPERKTFMYRFGGNG